MNCLTVAAAALCAFAGFDGETAHAPAGTGHALPGRAEITLTLVNTFQPEGKALGLYFIEETALLGVNNTDMKVYFYSPTTGTVTAEIDLEPSNTDCFGVVFDPEHPGGERFYTNDWSGTDLFYTLNWGASWNTVFDPSFDAGRGMDFDGEYYWTTNGTGSIIRFLPEFTPFDVLSVPETDGQLSGITAFPYEGDIAVAIASYGGETIWLYIWNGTALEYLGAGTLPVAFETSYGLAYSEDLESMFWSYRDPSYNYQISQLSLEIGTALEQITWGGIKTFF